MLIIIIIQYLPLDKDETSIDGTVDVELIIGTDDVLGLSTN